MKRILIIDDDNLVCKTYDALIKAYFLKKGEEYETEIHMDGDKAIKRVVENNFNLAIVDLNLKNRDFTGVDVARECIMAGKPVIICSGSTFITKIKSYMDLKKFNNYIVHLDKPIKMEELFETLDHLLGVKIDQKVIFDKINS